MVKDGLVSSPDLFYRTAVMYNTNTNILPESSVATTS
jgi:hypothetical protein